MFIKRISIKTISVLIPAVLLVGCIETDSNAPKEASSTFVGDWKTDCIYLGAVSDQSIINTISYENNLLALGSTTYSLATCEGDVVRSYQNRIELDSSAQVLIDGYEGICLQPVEGRALVFHIDSDFAYSTDRIAPDVEGYVLPEVDCLNFNDFDFEISFTYPYKRFR